MNKDNYLLGESSKEILRMLQHALKRHDTQPDNPALNRGIFLMIDALIQKGLLSDYTGQSALFDGIEQGSDENRLS